MLLVFEGIDGSGKTAVASGTLRRLRACGVDVSSLVLAESLLGTSEVLGYGGDSTSLASDVVPDLVVLVDADPALARARRATTDISNSKKRAATAVALSLQYRLRRGYVRLARSEPDSWVIVDNELPLEETVSKVCRLVERALEHGTRQALAEFRAASRRFPHLVKPILNSPVMALADVLAWIRRRAEAEPAVAAYWLSGWCGPRVDDLRRSLTPRAPNVMLASTCGLADEVSFEIRDQLALQHPRATALSLTGLSGARSARARVKLARVAPAEVASSLTGCDDAEASSLRESLVELCPDQVLESLAFASSNRAWHLREHWLSGRGAHFHEDPVLSAVALRSVRGVAGERAWAIRAPAAGSSPLETLRSITGLTDEASWRLREQAISCAPELVMESIAGVLDERAWRLRSSVADACKQALDGMVGISAARAWALRDEYRDLWPSTVVKSLSSLAYEPRGAALIERQLRVHGGDASVLRHAAAIALKQSALDPLRVEGKARASLPGARKVTRL